MRIEKRGANTEWSRVAGAIRQVPQVAVGFAGLKDRHAVARQHFTVQLPGRSVDWSLLDMRGVRGLDVARHSRKLKRGALVGNGFRTDLRGIEGDRERAEAILATLRTAGAPNYRHPALRPRRRQPGAGGCSPASRSVAATGAFALPRRAARSSTRCLTAACARAAGTGWSPAICATRWANAPGSGRRYRTRPWRGVVPRAKSIRPARQGRAGAVRGRLCRARTGLRGRIR
ncbi:MAG: tRNA pseudouridine(13) synthase TruD [Rhodanobacteraceae bacterium]|nr:tRNA pseudouridine(13) synthase TruD [Rhodanobacteraceae bacterium]